MRVDQIEVVFRLKLSKNPPRSQKPAQSAIQRHRDEWKFAPNEAIVPRPTIRSHRHRVAACRSRRRKIQHIPRKPAAFRREKNMMHTKRPVAHQTSVLPRVAVGRYQTIEPQIA